MTDKKWQPAWEAQDFETKEVSLRYDSIFKVHSYTLRHRQFNQTWSEWVVRELISRQDAAAAVLYDPIQHKVVMVEQFRVGLIPHSQTQSPWLLEIVAGLIEEGESAQTTIYREALEESGCEIKELITIGEFYNTPGGFSEKTTVFCGIVDVTGIAGVHGLNTEDEDILVHVLNPDVLFQAMDDQQLVSSASTVIALQWLRLYFISLKGR